MTRLDKVNSRSVTRCTSVRGRGDREVIIRLEVGGKLVRFKLKGERHWHTANVEQLYWIAVGNTARLKMLAKAAAKAQKREVTRATSRR